MARHDSDGTGRGHERITPPQHTVFLAGSFALPVAGRHRPRWHNYTAFVLSGGGARGALQVGALRALLECGEYPDLIVGTSIGSWNGAWLARTPTLEGVEQLAEIWRGLSAAQVLLGRDPYPRSPAQAITGLFMVAAIRRVTQGAPSLYSDAGLRQLVSRHLGTTRFEELRIPLCIVAADLTHGTRAVFTRGPLAHAVLASSAIPGIFPPVRIGNAYYVDGGAVDNVSLDVAIRLGARRLFVLDVGYDEDKDHQSIWTPTDETSTQGSRAAISHPLAAVIERSAQVLAHFQLNRALTRVPQGIETHVLRLGAHSTGGVLEFSSASEWVNLAYEQTRTYLRARRRASSSREHRLPDASIPASAP